MTYELDARAPARPNTGEKPAFSGTSPSGGRIAFDNVSMLREGRPSFGVSGEIHYTRLRPETWEDRLLKMRQGGVNIVSTYVIWICHEEIEGQFDWSGSRDLRKFVQLCGSLGMDVIVRIGPFCHGELRNGGLPDWLYGRPFRLRSNDEGYLAYVRRYFGEIARQLEGLYFKDGGPIIGTQIENEYMHAGAPWNLTCGVSDEWVTAGEDGEEHLLRLQAIAREMGIVTPFYTCTAWGGAAAPAEAMLPLWGGYAYWPWVFYDETVQQHPLTPEYIFRDYHNNARPACYNFEPRYAPEDLPYACCEMGGGMTCFYRYRFILDPDSVPAMAIMKLGGGCNFLGYYMYCGGTQPEGKTTAFLNENALPQRSYDFQACVGEYGQQRPHYHSLRLLHAFVRTFEADLCPMQTVLPCDTDGMDPADTRTLRYCARVSGDRGFLFLNNYQDHLDMPDKEGVSVAVRLPGGDVTLPDMTLRGGVSCILPLHLDLDGVDLVYATAQPITRLDAAGETAYFFQTPRGMRATYAFRPADLAALEGAEAENGVVRVPDRPLHDFALRTPSGRRLRIITLDADTAPWFYVAEIRGRRHALLCEGGLLLTGDEGRLQRTVEEGGLWAYPALPRGVEASGAPCPAETRGVWTHYALPKPAPSAAVSYEEVGPGRITVQVPDEGFEGLHELLLQVRYVGDIGSAYIAGRRISDNFCNGAPWEFGLMEHRQALRQGGLYLHIAPQKIGSRVLSQTTMAGRSLTSEREVAQLQGLDVLPVVEIDLHF